MSNLLDIEELTEEELEELLLREDRELLFDDTFYPNEEEDIESLLNIHDLLL